MPRRRSKTKARYIYNSTDPATAKFLGKWENGNLIENPDVDGDPWNECVALTPSEEKNDYPPIDRIVSPPDEIWDENGGFVGYAFRYK